MVQLAKDYEPQGVQLVAISANSIQSHPQDGPEKMAEDARHHGALAIVLLAFFCGLSDSGMKAMLSMQAIPSPTCTTSLRR